VGGTADTSTGLTNEGAREYDAQTASFISPDSVLTATDPQDLNPYAYAGDNPSTDSDPSGLCMESWCPPPPAHGTNPHPSNDGPGHYVGDTGYSDTCYNWLPGCPGFTGGGAGQSGEQRIGPGYYRLTGTSPTRTTRAVRRNTTSLLGADCVGRLFALGACPREVQDTIKDLSRSNMPVWAIVSSGHFSLPSEHDAMTTAVPRS
jgi:RHS repeat-associated protein